MTECLFHIHEGDVRSDRQIRFAHQSGGDVRGLPRSGTCINASQVRSNDCTSVNNVGSPYDWRTVGMEKRLQPVGNAVERSSTEGIKMTAYTIAHLLTPTINADVVEYIDRVQDTLTPHGGRFLVHGGDVEVMEGHWPGSVVVIQFPDTTAAHAWYASPAYRQISAKRTDHVKTDAIIVEGVAVDYDPRQTAARLRLETLG